MKLRHILLTTLLWLLLAAFVGVFILALLDTPWAVKAVITTVLVVCGGFLWYAIYKTIEPRQ